MDEQLTFEFEQRPTIKGFPELRWTGKRPYRSTQYYPAQLRESYGEEQSGWINKIFWGDNLQVMSHLLKEYRGKIDLIYIDPPFDSKADYKRKIEVRGIGKAESDSTSFEEKQYSDIWTNDEYLQFMYERLILLQQLLSETGAIYIHCDHRKAAHIKLLCDEIFGQDNFLNQITWRRQIPRGMKVYAKYYSFSSDYILIYSKDSSKTRWNRQTYTRYITLEEAEKKYNKDETGFFRTSDPGSYSFESLCKLHKEGRLYAPKNGEIIIDHNNRQVYASKGGKVAVKYYREQIGDKVAEEVTIDNIWDDIPGMGIVSSEFLEYPTQKPEKLLERIIKASTEPGDLVFDCFMGSGTTQAVAMKLGRRFIGADINLGAIQTTTKRLLAVAKELDKTNEAEQQTSLSTYSSDEELYAAASAGNTDTLTSEERAKVIDFLKAKGMDTSALEKDIKYTGFEVYNVNNYEFFRNPVEARDLLIAALEIQAFPQGNIWDGELDGRMVKIMPVNRIATKADLKELIANMPYKTYEKRKEENPNQPVERITIVCMGHEPDLKGSLEQELSEYKVDVQIVDILRDKKDLQLKRDSEAEIVREGSKLVIRAFYPMNLMQKLSLQKEYVEDWRQLVDSIMIDWNYDGVIMQPAVADVPGKNELVIGIYDIPEDAGTIKVKITDLLSESLEVEVR